MWGAGDAEGRTVKGDTYFDVLISSIERSERP